MTHNQTSYRLVYIDAIKYWADRLTENPDNAIAWTAITRLTKEAQRLGKGPE